jgi:hypothetical protein
MCVNTDDVQDDLDEDLKEIEQVSDWPIIGIGMAFALSVGNRNW